MPRWAYLLVPGLLCQHYNSGFDSQHKSCSMAFVAVGGSGEPTWFEVLAADKLVPSLRAAVVYAMTVMSQRHAWVHRLLDYEDEVLALIMLVADWHSLASTDATFPESLYGLRRRRMCTLTNATAAAAQPALQLTVAPLHEGLGPPPISPPDAMTQRQRHLSLAWEVLVPYLRSKVDRVYKLQANQGPLGLALQRGVLTLAATPLSSLQDAPAGQWVRAVMAKAFVAAYPCIHAGLELASFGWHLAFLVGSLSVHRPGLHALGLQMARVSAQDMARSSHAKAAAQHAALAATLTPGRNPALGVLQRGGLRVAFLVGDHARNALILAVFGFKALEWWFTSAEERLAAGKTLPPPPPPPAPRPSSHGVSPQLPDDLGVCPVCKQQCVNPTQVATSGYVGCYQCIFLYIQEHARCPVTQLPSTVEHVRKLYAA